MSKNYVPVCELENEVETRMIETILDENAIPHMIREADSVPLPVFDVTDGYATLYADEEYAEEIRELVAEMRDYACELETDFDADEDGEEDGYFEEFDE